MAKLAQKSKASNQKSGLKGYNLSYDAGLDIMRCPVCGSMIV